MNELVVIGADFDFNLIFVFNGRFYIACQSGFDNVFHCHIQGEFNVICSHRSLFTVVEVYILTQVHDDMGIIYELPVGSQTGAETLLALRAVIEEYQSLVSVLQNNVVGSVLLFLQVKVVDIGIGTDNQLLLVWSTAVVSFLSSPPQPATAIARIIKAAMMSTNNFS